LMDDAALVGPVVMQRENEILEGHEQSSRCYGGLDSRTRCVEMSDKINRNAQNLSSRNPSRIKELQHVISQNGWTLGIRAHELFRPNFSD
jgi:hypothetical protein